MFIMWILPLNPFKVLKKKTLKVPFAGLFFSFFHYIDKSEICDRFNAVELKIILMIKNLLSTIVTQYDSFEAYPNSFEDIEKQFLNCLDPSFKMNLTEEDPVLKALDYLLTLLKAEYENILKHPGIELLMFAFLRSPFPGISFSIPGDKTLSVTDYSKNSPNYTSRFKIELSVNSIIVRSKM